MQEMEEDSDNGCDGNREVESWRIVRSRLVRPPACFAHGVPSRSRQDGNGKHSPGYWNLCVRGYLIGQNAIQARPRHCVLRIRFVKIFLVWSLNVEVGDVD
jgi:hypothetical protein